MILDQALRAAVEITGATRALILLTNDKRTTARGRRGLGIPNEVAEEVVASLMPAASGDVGVVSSVLVTGEPALTAIDDPRPCEFATPGFGPFTHALTVPLVGRLGTDGVISAAWGNLDDAPDSEVVDLLMILADHVAAAIDTQRRLDVERRERAIAEELHRVAQRITTGLSLDDVLSAVLRAVERLLGATSASIYLAGGAGTIANRRFTTRNTGEPHWDEHTRTRPNGLTATTLHTGRPVVIEDAWNDPRTRSRGKGDSRTFVAMPIRHDDHAIGVLYANWRERRLPRDGDLRLLDTLAAYGAVAIDNTRLHEAEIEAARFDGVLLAARTVAHEINNDLALTMGMAEIAQMQAHAGQLPDPAILGDVIQGAQRIAKHVRQLQGVVRLEERRVHDLPPLLDLGNSTE